MEKSNNKTQIKRSPKRAVYDKDRIYEVLDENFLCHIGFVHHDVPFVIPIIYGRDDDRLYIHGSSISRMIKEMSKGIEVCITVTKINGLVLAKSAYNHSLNYESVMIFGIAKIVNDDEEKISALKCISDHMLKGRWEETRLPNSKELNVTTVLSVEIEEFSCKIRTGFPEDNKSDLELEIWSGILPIETNYKSPIPDSNTNIKLPKSLKKYNL